MEYFRVMVKLDGMTRYQAIMEDAEGILLAPPNVIYHSYFTYENAEKLKKELEAHGITAKIVK